LPIFFKFVRMAKAAKKKAAPKKQSKPRAEHYDPKLSINGSFADVIGVAMGKQPTEKKEEKK
jgi:hypothetical protein